MKISLMFHVRSFTIKLFTEMSEVKILGNLGDFAVNLLLECVD